MTQTFDYGITSIRDLSVDMSEDKNGKSVIDRIIIKDRAVKPTSRFWSSLHLRFGFTDNIFRYFSHKEVFQRISERAPNDEFRFCIENQKKGDGKLLAATSPTTPLIPHDDLMNILKRYDATDYKYTNGIITSHHRPRSSGGPVQIAGDGFESRFVIDTPIDGFGRPSVFLSMMRMVCSNGMIGYSPAFRSELSVGKGDENVGFALIRALDGFNNEEGYSAMRQRFESSAKSWASVYEVNKLYKVLARLTNSNDIPGSLSLNAAGGDGASELSGTPLFSSFHNMTGDLSEIYGLANLNTLTVKRQRTLPAACRVYDLINFSSEVATHHATAHGNRTLQAYLGDLISNEYDLEGTAEQYDDWRDFFINDSDTTETLAGMHRQSA